MANSTQTRRERFFSKVSHGRSSVHRISFKAPPLPVDLLEAAIKKHDQFHQKHKMRRREKKCSKLSKKEYDVKLDNSSTNSGHKSAGSCEKKHFKPHFPKPPQLPKHGPFHKKKANNRGRDIRISQIFSPTIKQSDSLPVPDSLTGSQYFYLEEDSMISDQDSLQGNSGSPVAVYEDSSPNESSRGFSESKISSLSFSSDEEDYMRSSFSSMHQNGKTGRLLDSELQKTEDFLLVSKDTLEEENGVFPPPVKKASLPWFNHTVKDLIP